MIENDDDDIPPSLPTSPPPIIPLSKPPEIPATSDSDQSITSNDKNTITIQQDIDKKQELDMDKEQEDITQDQKAIDEEQKDMDEEEEEIDDDDDDNQQEDGQEEQKELIGAYFEISYRSSKNKKRYIIIDTNLNAFVTFKDQSMTTTKSIWPFYQIQSIIHHKNYLNLTFNTNDQIIIKSNTLHDRHLLYTAYKRIKDQNLTTTNPYETIKPNKQLLKPQPLISGILSIFISHITFSYHFLNQLSHIYCIIQIGNATLEKEPIKSSIKYNTFWPNLQEEYQIQIGDPSEEILKIIIMEYKKFKNDKYIGEMVYNIKDIAKVQEIPIQAYPIYDLYAYQQLTKELQQRKSTRIAEKISNASLYAALAFEVE